MVKGQHGYGFNLHNDKAKRGQFVRAVDPGSAAEHAALRPGDRVVEVRLNSSRHAGIHRSFEPRYLLSPLDQIDGDFHPRFLESSALLHLR